MYGSMNSKKGCNKINVDNSQVEQTMGNYLLVEVDLVHDEVDHVLVEAVGFRGTVLHTDDHFLRLYVEFQHLSV